MLPCGGPLHGIDRTFPLIRSRLSNLLISGQVTLSALYGIWNTFPHFKKSS